MLNNNQGGLDPANARAFGGQFGAPAQSQGGYPLGANLAGLHNIPGASYSLQNALPQGRGIGGLPSGGGNQQSRYGAQNLPAGLQQYSQVANRGGLPMMNGLNGGGGQRPGGGQGLGPAGRGGGGGGLAGLGLGPNLQRNALQGIGALNSLGQRGMPSLGLGGGGGHLGVQQLGSPARSGYGGLGHAGMGAGAHQASGDLLAMINKSGGAGLGLGGGQPGFPPPPPVASQAGGGQQAAREKQEQPAFDASEFPALGGGGRAGGGGDAAAAEGASLYANLGVHKGMLPSEFNMQSEEFPALPGASRPPEERPAGEAGPSAGPSGPGSHQADAGRLGQRAYELPPGQQQQQAAQQGAGGGAPPGASHEQLLRLYQMQGRFPQGMKAQAGGGMAGVVGGAGGLGAGADAGGQPAGKLASLAQDPADRFGLRGLLTVIRMTDPDLTTLALGTDLTTLGLHLNSPDNVFKTFASPWADQPLKPEPEYKVPACYRHPPPRLRSGYFAKFQQETLFYVFHSMPADEAQVFAADELASRGWWFHKELKLWLMRVPGSEPTLKAAHMERGSYLVFDTGSWEVVRKDNFVLSYDSLERPPSLPRPPAPPPAQPPPPPQK